MTAEPTAATREKLASAGRFRKARKSSPRGVNTRRRQEALRAAIQQN